MNRREVLKVLGALPIAAALGGCHHEKEEKPDRLQIHLDGAFAVVIRQNKSNSILAFSPRPTDVTHQLKLNGTQLEENKSGGYHFELSTESVRTERRSHINVGLEDFYFQTEKWRIPDSLITIELPCPKTITFSGQSIPVVFASNGWHVSMPTNHILEYELDKDAQPKITCSDVKQNLCSVYRDSPKGLSRFLFEVAPARTTNNHPVDFFNYILHSAFPDLEERYKLLPQDHGQEKPAEMSSRLVPAAWQVQNPSDLLRPVTYTLDCKFAGPLVQTSASPIGV